MSEEFRRVDGRKPDEMRPYKIKAHVLKNADGSAEIRLGKNWIVAAVYGPKEHFPKFEVLHDRAILNCRYHMTPYSTSERKSPKPSRREIELSKVIRSALEQAVILEEYPEMSIDVFIEVLQADGSTRVASITAAAVALADAGIPMKDLVVGCSAGKINGRIIVDVGEYEDKEGEADLPIAIMPNLRRVVLLQMDGKLTHEEFKKAFDMALKGAYKLYEEQINALKSVIKNMEVLEGEDRE
ncbi:exosome complex exonuclease Rrp41 [Candidatus Geothermarchaeota archaeon]|nr:MAG: exosome complex exonuclease Rrp41 [Candidatus Geothermarchaeota archaeon]